MTDLIWIGNTLYPRWVVFAAIALIAVTLAAITSALSRPERGGE